MINYRLKELEKEGKRIKVGVIGAGRMGTGLVCQIAQMQGMRTVAIADTTLDRAVEAYKINGIKEEDIIITDDVKTAIDSIARGKMVVTKNGQIIPECPVDAVVDATGIPEIGARTAFNSIMNKKHVVTLTVEADVVVGPILKILADNARVVYTLADGDEPPVIKGLYDFADSLGFKILAALKGDGPIDHYATPETLTLKATKKNLNPKMYTSFRDGTKTNVELAAVANATGLIPDVRGMHGPECTVKDSSKIFDLKEKGGILQNEGVVDYCIGGGELSVSHYDDYFTGGVALVVTTKHPQIRKDLKYLFMGEGPNFTLYRPYHLCAIETPLSIARAVIYNEPTLTPMAPIAEVIAVAKRDLKTGEILDGEGGFTVYGQIERGETAKRENLLPIGLANGIPLIVAVAKDEPVRYDMVKLNEDSILLVLKRLQDKMFAKQLKYST